MSNNDNLPSVMRVHCNRCHQETVHDVLAGDDNGLWEWDDVPNSPGAKKPRRVGDDLLLIVMCQGCGHKCFSRYQDHYDIGNNCVIYPLEIRRQRPQWYEATSPLNEDLFSLLDEIYGAIDLYARRLAAMGIRAALEYLCIEKVGDHGSFASNLKMFQDQGFISAIESASVVRVLDVGNAAIHRFHRPSDDDIFGMLDILEHLIHALYVHDQISAKFSPMPPRKTLRKNGP